MIKHRIIKDESGTIDLCETYSTEKNCVGFIQKETGIMYTENPIDVIVGYIDGEPYPKYNYEEVIEEREDKNGITTQEWERKEIIQNNIDITNDTINFSMNDDITP